MRDGAEVLKDVSFSVAPGEIYALLGGNGAGKSTTLLTFLGFLAPSSGSALVGGRLVGSFEASAGGRIDTEAVHAAFAAREAA